MARVYETPGGSVQEMAKHLRVTMSAMALSVRRADISESAELAAVAAATFALACPPTADPADIAAAIETNLSVRRFADYLADPDRVIFAASEDGAIVGYSLLIRGIGEDPHVAASVPDRPAVELSKMYVLSHCHRTGAAALLMANGIDWAAHNGAAVVWLGVNRNNERAQRFYRKHGFQVAGTRVFRLGSSNEDDFVMIRRL